MSQGRRTADFVRPACQDIARVSVHGSITRKGGAAAGHEQTEIDEVAPVERNLLHSVCLYNMADGSCRTGATDGQAN